MNLSARIGQLETKLQPSSVPVFSIVLGTGDDSQPYSVKHDGKTWTQEPGEDVHDLLERAKADALRTFRPHGNQKALYLVACRPRLTKDQWLDRFNPPGVQWENSSPTQVE